MLEREEIGEPVPPITLLERTCRTLCEIGIVAMAAVVILELITRNLFNFSFMMSDELGGYIVVGITFLSLPVCQVSRAYHHVLFVQARLSPRARAVSHLLFQLLSLGLCLLLVWQLTRYVLQTYDSGDIAPTELGTPLWIPQVVMPVGCLALCVTLLRAIAMSVRRMLGVRS
jgi:TRAP-type C4-dicarboxylate transport system permease small subunit